MREVKYRWDIWEVVDGDLISLVYDVNCRDRDTAQRNAFDMLLDYLVREDQKWADKTETQIRESLKSGVRSGDRLVMNSSYQEETYTLGNGQIFIVGTETCSCHKCVPANRRNYM